MQPTVLILGANGRFGRAATASFIAQGWQVLAVARRPPTQVSPAPLRWVAGDVTDWPALVERVQALGLAPVDVVIHALNPKAYTGAAWRREVPQMMEAAIAVAERLGATLMIPGNVYNFGTAMPPILTEDTPQNADTVKGRCRVAMEQQLAAAVQQGRVRAIVVRTGDFFGHDAGTWLDLAMGKKLDQGRFTWMGRMEVSTPWAYLPDLTLAFARVAARRADLPPMALLQFAGHQASGLTWHETCAQFARARGWLAPEAQLRVGAMPWALFGALRWAVPLFASLYEMRYLWTTPHALDNQRLVALIGPEPRTDFAIAVAQSLAHVGPAGASSALVAA